jgi:hypothetical protein
MVSKAVGEDDIMMIGLLDFAFFAPLDGSSISNGFGGRSGPSHLCSVTVRAAPCSRMLPANFATS